MAFRPNREFIRHVPAYSEAGRGIERILANKRSERISNENKE